MDKHKHFDVFEDYANFLKIIKNLKPYMIEFEKDRIIKTKVYPDDCIIKSQNWHPVIIITHDKCIFLVNNIVRQVWTKKKDIYL